jgi:endoglucanase
MTSSSYATALRRSLQFYEAQRSGPFEKNRIAWRKSAFEKDVVPGGYFDAGDHLKLVFPMATSLAFLGMAALEFTEGFKAAKQWSKIREALRWGADFLVGCHVAPTKLIGQIGDPGPDHAYWGPPELYKGPRPHYTWDLETQPASDLAGAVASALAVTALVCKADKPYAATLLKHAEQLYAVGKRCQGKYSDHYRNVTHVYTSGSFKDDLALAATLLWRATKNDAYLQDAKAFRASKDFNPNSFVSWDSVGVLSAILLDGWGQGSTESTVHIDRFLEDWQDGRSGFTYTPKGLCIAPLGGWGNLRYSTTAAFAQLLCAKFSERRKAKALAFARQQIDYALGLKGSERSFVVGFGRNPPKRPHHRAASCPPGTSGWEFYNSEKPNPHVIAGALVGGPKGPGDDYVDDRKDFQQNEVAIDFNAGFTGALAGLLQVA